VSGLLQGIGRGDPRVLSASLVIGSMLLYLAGANLAWYYRVTPGGGRFRLIGPLVGSSYARPAYEIWRFVYYVGLPYVALFVGWVDLRAMGLGFLDWAKGLRWAIVLGLATWSLLMFVWVPYLRATVQMPIKVDPQGTTWARRVVEVVYMQAHWAFYRAACILLLTTVFPDDLAVYWGASAGIALTFLEAWADPRVRRHIARLGEGEPALWGAGQAIINTVGFVLTRNVWLLTLLHLALEFSVPHLRAAPRLEVPELQPSRLKAPNVR
jgi:hypothetical protein